MVSLLEPVVPPPPPVLLLSLPPQAAMPKARAATRQLGTASERTRKIPSSRNAIREEGADCMDSPGHRNAEPCAVDREGGAASRDCPEDAGAASARSPLPRRSRR